MITRRSSLGVFWRIAVITICPVAAAASNFGELKAQWDLCVKAHIQMYFKTGEAAETIVRAAYGKCEGPRKNYVVALQNATAAKRTLEEAVELGKQLEAENLNSYLGEVLDRKAGRPID
jgi:hypothetical protein